MSGVCSFNGFAVALDLMWSDLNVTGDSTTLTISGSSGTCIRAAKNSRVRLRALAGTGNSGTGISLASASSCIFENATGFVTSGHEIELGAYGSDFPIAFSAVVTGLAADTSDFSQSSPQMCSIVHCS